MPKIPIEKIYPQHEKELNDQRLLKVCDLEKAEKNRTADGTKLMKLFTSPRVKAAGVKIFKDKGFEKRSFPSERLRAVESSYYL